MSSPFDEIFDKIDEFILEHGNDGYRHLYSLAMLGAFPGILNVLGFKLNKDGYNESEFRVAFKYKSKLVESLYDRDYNSIIAYEIKFLSDGDKHYYEAGRIPASTIENYLRDMELAHGPVVKTLKEDKKENEILA
ncbi:MAG: hypothetical protein J7K87_02925 [Candidatus Aenigmarchaeota archaeon]|nr:hypothetical protein [Candidatus Aenigmarchaeota archaeon]